MRRLVSVLVCGLAAIAAADGGKPPPVTSGAARVPAGRSMRDRPPAASPRHGLTGEGNGPVSFVLKPAPRNFTRDPFKGGERTSIRCSGRSRPASRARRWSATPSCPMTTGGHSRPTCSAFVHASEAVQANVDDDGLDSGDGDARAAADDRTRDGSGGRGSARRIPRRRRRRLRRDRLAPIAAAPRLAVPTAPTRARLPRALVPTGYRARLAVGDALTGHLEITGAIADDSSLRSGCTASA